jgi:predicted permease
MFLDFFKVAGFAVVEIFILAAIGYFLVKKNILNDSGLDALSSLVVKITLPFLIFSQLIKDFSFGRYPDWWVFPLVSLAVTIAGLIIGVIFAGFIRNYQRKLQFLGLVMFQNSGYLPLALVATLLPKDKADTMFIYIFLFLLGFNLIIWSLGIYVLSFSRTDKAQPGSLFSPPVVATVFSLVFILFGLNRIIPEFIIRPLKMAGDCTLPLAMLVVGGNLAQIRLGHIDKKAMSLLVLAKLVVLPLLGLWVVAKLNLPELIGLLIIMQLAVPSATSLSVLIRHYKKEDLLVSQGIFFSHILSLITLPVFLSLYFMRVMIR